MRRTISGTAVAVLASVTLLAGCADEGAETTDPAVDDPAVTEEPLDDTATLEEDMEEDMSTMEEDMEEDMSTMEDMATMEPTDG